MGDKYLELQDLIDCLFDKRYDLEDEYKDLMHSAMCAESETEKTFFFDLADKILDKISDVDAEIEDLKDEQEDVLREETYKADENDLNRWIDRGI